ncbi:unnamed protein product [Notodromas monacha]|uniref:Uncharacterized protein n=1 Tax=Notodromas monacha TaxID=399045 RepID=A0A7R9GB03_9CRUS|nr:unnamed protein product [Notodromas monacha]CAG0914571.1 unnamed protein product [Notodromas monacha]
MSETESPIECANPRNSDVAVVAQESAQKSDWISSEELSTAGSSDEDDHDFTANLKKRAKKKKKSAEQQQIVAEEGSLIPDVRPKTVDDNPEPS